MAREASVERNTKETEIKLKLNLDGTGYSDIETGVGFFDHMLDGFTRHGLFDLAIRVHGDLQVDDHHKIPVLCLVPRSKRPLGTKKASAATEAVFCLWMKFWCCVLLIYPDALIFHGMQNLHLKKSEICPPKW